MTTLVRSQTNRITTTSTSREDVIRALIDVSGRLREAMDRAGTRSCAYDLLEAADALDAVLPAARDLVRAQHGELPERLRAAMATLQVAGGQTRALGRAASSVVPSRAVSTAALVGHLDESAYAVDLVITDLDR